MTTTMASPSSPQAMTSEDPFLQQHLSDIPSHAEAALDAKRDLLRCLGRDFLATAAILTLLDYLNLISDVFHSLLPESRCTSSPLHFSPTSTGTLVLHPRAHKNNSAAPEAVGTYIAVEDPSALLSDFNRGRLPWHYVETIIHVVDDLTQPQFNMDADLLEARPDRPAMYYLLLDRFGQFLVGWTDSSGRIASAVYDTHQLEVLERFVYSLYVPPAGHILVDPTVKRDRMPAWDGPTYTITSGDVQYKEAQITFCGEAFGRRTTVYRCNKRGRISIIKDVYIEEDLYRPETSFLESIHSDGVLPTVVQLKHTETVFVAEGIPCRTVEEEESESRLPVLCKTRLIFGTDGQHWSEATSVRDLCMAAFDVNEALLALTLQHKVLHCDISPNNVLIYPEHDIEWMKSLSKKFIFGSSQVSCKVIGLASEPIGLLIDFDRAAAMEPDHSRYGLGKYDERSLQEVNGTPGFMARSVAKLTVLPHYGFYEMPRLEGEAKELYIHAYGQETYESWTDKPGQAHGVSPTINEGPDAELPNFKHHEDHDDEALFWTLLKYVLFATPRDDEDDEDTKAGKLKKLRAALSCFRGHKPLTPGPEDPRDVFFAMSEHDWQAVLPSALAPVVPLIMNMARQVYPEYALLKERPRSGHLHEALRRLLLTFIVERRYDTIRLVPGKERVPADSAESLVCGHQAQSIDYVALFGTYSSTAGSQKAQVLSSEYSAEDFEKHDAEVLDEDNSLLLSVQHAGEPLSLSKLHSNVLPKSSRYGGATASESDRTTLRAEGTTLTFTRDVAEDHDDDKDDDESHKQAIHEETPATNKSAIRLTCIPDHHQVKENLPSTPTRKGIIGSPTKKTFDNRSPFKLLTLNRKRARDFDSEDEDEDDDDDERTVDEEEKLEEVASNRENGSPRRAIVNRRRGAKKVLVEYI